MGQRRVTSWAALLELPMVVSFRTAVALAGLVALLSVAPAKEVRLTVAPAAVDRAGLVVSFKLAPGERNATVATSESGQEFPLQVEADGTARFVIPFQKAGETRVFRLQAAPTKPPPRIETKADAQRLHVMLGGAPMFDFQLDREALPRADIKPDYKRAGYIHPVYSPSGKVVTDDYPSNHPHHHGIWTPWTKTQFQGRSPDFWNVGAKKTGKEDLVALDRTWSGPVHGGFEARLQMIDLSAPNPVVALNETWRVTAYDVPVRTNQAPVRMFDLELTQTCATNDPVLLPKYHYGGFGFRGADAWNGPGDAALFLTSEGITDRIKGNDTRGRWCYLGGKLEGAIAGTAVLGHPDNFRAPQPLRLHPNMPYFSYVPQQLGDFAIEPGKAYVARFRFIVADGAPDRSLIDAYWNAYATPLIVKIAPTP
jgi:hypothetical protein